MRAWRASAAAAVHTQPKPWLSRFPADPLQVLIAISLALSYIHGQKNIVHRDLTPANIVLGQVGARGAWRQVAWPDGGAAHAGTRARMHTHTNTHACTRAHTHVRMPRCLQGPEGLRHSKLADFGLAKRLSSSVVGQSLVGTMPFTCPEIIQQVGPHELCLRLL